ncbi:diamine acetyltransferase 1-like [Elgaria multicarinata webbii]|uniref:diamine acetyltransferase 1-like n=1 Tax=Elgaria multicarinata webbii TaxID=159646 RepID=UPI002FCD5255
MCDQPGTIHWPEKERLQGSVFCPSLPERIPDIVRHHEVPFNTIRTNVEELRGSGFGTHPRYECFVAEVSPDQKSKEGYTLVGSVLSSYTYNCWRGKNLYMDNLYVMPEFRGKGIGQLLMERATQVAWHRGCTELQMCISSTKGGKEKFLAWRNAEDLTLKEGWNLFQIDTNVLWRMAAQSKF